MTSCTESEKSREWDVRTSEKKCKTRLWYLEIPRLEIQIITCLCRPRRNVMQWCWETTWCFEILTGGSSNSFDTNYGVLKLYGDLKHLTLFQNTTNRQNINIRDFSRVETPLQLCYLAIWNTTDSRLLVETLLLGFWNSTSGKLWWFKWPTCYSVCALNIDLGHVNEFWNDATTAWTAKSWRHQECSKHTNVFTFSS